MDKVLIVGDLHLGSSLVLGRPSVDGSLNSRISDQVRLLNWVSDQAIYNHVSHIVLCGDIFHELKPDTNLILIFIDWLKQCISHNINIEIISGNHDIKRVGTRYSSILDIINAAELEHVSIHNRIYTLQLENAGFTFVPFRDKRALSCETVEEAINKIKTVLEFERTCIFGKKVLVGHLAIEKAFFTDEIDDVVNELMVPLNTFEGYDYVWMGHVHKPQIFSKSPHIAHIGSMDISDFGETEQEKIAILFEGDSFRTIPIPTRPLKRVRSVIPKDKNPTDYLLTQLNEDYTSAIVKIEVEFADPEAPELDRDIITKAIYNKEAYYISGFSESRTIKILSEDKEEWKSVLGPEEAIKKYAEQNKLGDKFISVCLDLIKENA